MASAPTLPGLRLLPIGRAWLLAAGILAAVLGLEGATWAIFRWPRVWVARVPGPVEDLLRNYHKAFLGGGPIQVRPDCSEPDPELLYRLKSGECRFATDEFDTTVRVSRRHLREDREIGDPDLVVLGDSFSLGWGVEREEAYPAALARILGLREVVVATSSYGTVRELLLLRRLALKDFRGVVLQHYANDLEENQTFLRNGRHEPSPPAAYAQVVDIWARVNDKTFLKRSRHWLSLAFWSLTKPPLAGEPGPPAAEQARIALAILGAFSTDLRGKPIVVFSADRGPDSAEFARAFNESEKPEGLGPALAIDATRGLDPSDYFTLDVHWRPHGHRVVAEVLGAAVSELWSEPARELEDRLPTGRPTSRRMGAAAKH